MAENAQEWLDSLTEDQLKGFTKVLPQLMKPKDEDDDDYANKITNKAVEKAVEKAKAELMKELGPVLGAVSRNTGMEKLTKGLSDEETKYIEDLFEKNPDAALGIASDPKTLKMVRLAAKQAVADDKASKEEKEEDPKVEKKEDLKVSNKEIGDYKADMAKMGITFENDEKAVESFERAKVAV